MDIVHLMDKELHDRGGQFQEHLRVMRSVGEQALVDHGTSTSMLKLTAVVHNILEEMFWPQEPVLNVGWLGAGWRLRREGWRE